jgi:hypothetical protein
MTTFSRSLSLIGVLAVSAAIPSCMSGKLTIAMGKPLDGDSLAAIRVSETGLRDILEWFGPPTQIVDGTQTILDVQASVTPTGQLATRTLSSRSGEVLLLYWTPHIVHSSDTLYLEHFTYTREREALRANEVMIVVRKSDYKVMGVMVGEDKS